MFGGFPTEFEIIKQPKPPKTVTIIGRFPLVHSVWHRNFPPPIGYSVKRAGRDRVHDLRVLVTDISAWWDIDVSQTWPEKSISFPKVKHFGGDLAIRNLDQIVTLPDYIGQWAIIACYQIFSGSIGNTSTCHGGFFNDQDDRNGRISS